MREQPFIDQVAVQEDAFKNGQAEVMTRGFNQSNQKRLCGYWSSSLIGAIVFGASGVCSTMAK